MKRYLSFLLAVLLAFSAVLGLASCKNKEGEPFDFAKEKMSKYISLDRGDYYGVSVEVDAPPEVSDKDVEDYIVLILKNVVEKKTYTDKPVEEGDTVTLYFRGEMDGVDFEGVSNMESSAATIEVGAGQFIEDLEKGLIGIVPNTTAFNRVDSGTVKSDYVAYTSYSYTYTDESGKEVTGTGNKRIDLANPAQADKALSEAIVGKTVGTAFTLETEYDIDGNGETELVSFDMKVKFASIEETVPVTVTFPDPYQSNEAYSGKEAVFHVVIKELKRTEIPELTEEVITNTIQFKSEKNATGEALIAEFKEYIRSLLIEQREGVIMDAALVKLFGELYDKVEIKSYPTKAVEEIETTYKEGIKAEFDSYKQYYSDFPYETVEEYAAAYFGESYNKELSYDEAMAEIAKEAVLSQMIPNYIIQKEKIDFKDKADRDARVRAAAEYYASYYSSMYGQQITAEQVLADIGEEALANEAKATLMYEALYEVMDVTVNIVEPAETEAE